MTRSDFKVQRHAATGDSSLAPTSDRARQYVREYRATFGDEALIGMSIYCETSRAPEYLTDTVEELRALGFTVRGVS